MKLIYDNKTEQLESLEIPPISFLQYKDNDAREAYLIFLELRLVYIEESLRLHINSQKEIYLSWVDRFNYLKKLINCSNKIYFEK